MVVAQVEGGDGWVEEVGEDCVGELGEGREDPLRLTSFDTSPGGPGEESLGGEMV